MKKKLVFKISLILMIIIILFFGFFYALIMYDEYKMYAPLPSNSKEGKIIVTSDGCCFYIEDIIISLVSGTNKVNIMKIGELYERDIFSSNIRAKLSGKVKINIKFKYYYGDEGTATIPVMEFENIETLKKQGLLLTFEERDDMYLVVKSKNQEITYKMNDGDWPQNDNSKDD